MLLLKTSQKKKNKNKKTTRKGKLRVGGFKVAEVTACLYVERKEPLGVGEGRITGSILLCRQEVVGSCL
jgi:hypothetical protein